MAGGADIRLHRSSELFNVLHQKNAFINMMYFFKYFHLSPWNRSDKLSSKLC